MLWLGTYCVPHPELILDDNATVFLDDDTEVQPDAFIWRPEPGGPRLTEDDYVEGAPQLVVEVAASSASYDLHDKLEAYRRNGVREYVVWRVEDAAIDWFRLRDGQYVRLAPDAEGVIESEEYPGLRLHVPSMLAGDRAAVLARLR
jgi:Uma2 family endonuclease